MKVCNTCGEMLADDFFYTNHKSCKSCRKLIDKIYYENNKEKKLLSMKKYRENNPEYYKNYHKNYHEKHKSDENYRKKRKEYKKNRKGFEQANYRFNKIEKLADSYIKDIMTAKYNISRSEITREMILLERSRLKLIRFIKTNK